jgi:hypothetical protein
LYTIAKDFLNQASGGKMLNMKLIPAVLVLFVLLSVVTACNNSTQTGSNTTSQAIPAKESTEIRTPEQNLAIIDLGHYVKNDDVAVGKYKILMDEISKKTPNSRQEIADMTAKAKGLIKSDYGKNITTLAILEEANKAMLPDSSWSYPETLSPLIVLMGK